MRIYNTCNLGTETVNGLQDTTGATSSTSESPSSFFSRKNIRNSLDFRLVPNSKLLKPQLTNPNSEVSYGMQKSWE
jgi:hypothetical protein